MWTTKLRSRDWESRKSLLQLCCLSCPVAALITPSVSKSFFQRCCWTINNQFLHGNKKLFHQAFPRGISVGAWRLSRFPFFIKCLINIGLIRFHHCLFEQGQFIIHVCFWMLVVVLAKWPTFKKQPWEFQYELEPWSLFFSHYTVLST